MSKHQIKAFELMAGDLLAELDYEVVYPAAILKPVRWHHYAWHHVQNLFIKLLRGEGFKGLYEKLYRLIHDSLRKLSFHLKSS